MSNHVDIALLEVYLLYSYTLIYGFKASISPTSNLILPDEIYQDNPGEYYYTRYLGDPESDGGFVPYASPDVTFKNKGISTLVLPEHLYEIWNTVIHLSSSGEPTFDGLFKDNNISNEIIIPETVSKIAKSSFENNLIPSVIFLGTELTSIEKAVFKNNKIESLILPEGVSVVEESAFENNLIQSLELTDDIRTIEKYAFKNNSIEELELFCEIDSIEQEAFKNNKIKILILKNSIYNKFDIGESAFENNLIEDLDTLFLSHINTIGKCAFKDNNIKSLGVLSVTTVGESAFENNLIEKLEFNHTHTIEKKAFKDNNIKSLGDYTPSTIKESAFENNNINNLVLPGRSINYKSNVFKNNPINVIIVPRLCSGTVSSTTFDGFNGDMFLDSFNFELTADIIDNFGEDYMVYAIPSIASELPNEVENVTVLPNTIYNGYIDYTVDGDTVIIHGFAEEGNFDRRKFNIGRSFVGSKVIIDEYAFADGEIEEVYIYDNIYEIRKGAFENCSIDTLNLVFALNLKHIGEDAFKNNNINTANFSNIEELEYIGIGAFDLNPFENPDLKCLNGSVRGFNENVPSKNKRYLILPSYYYDELNHIVKSVNGVFPSAFRDESDVEFVYIPSSCTTLGSGAFLSCSIKFIAFSEGLTSLPSGAFANNQLSGTLTLPNSITSIGSFSTDKRNPSLGAFSNNNITELNLHENITDIGDNTFSNNKLTNIDLPNSVEKVGMECFNDNLINNIDYSMGDNIINLGYRAFAGCYFNTLEIGNGIVALDEVCSGVKKLILGTNIETVEKNAFYNKDLSVLILNDNLETIGENAFGKNNLTYVRFPNTLKNINDEAFAYNKLNIVILNEGLLSIGYKSFAENPIKVLYLPETLISIGDACFIDNHLQHKLVIPSQIENIKHYTFYRADEYYVTKRKEIELIFPEGLKEIEADAFMNVSYERIILPSTLEKLDVGGHNFYYELISPGTDVSNSYCFVKELTILAETPVTSYSNSDRFFSNYYHIYVNDLKVRVPYQSVNAYKNHIQWSECSRITHIKGPVHPSILDYDIINGKVHLNGFIDSTIDFIEDLELPDKIEGYPVEVISDNAFENYSFSSILLPRYLKLIGDYAFYNDNQDMNIYSLSDIPPTISSTSFNNVNNVYIHSNYIKIYKDTESWYGYKNKIVPLNYHSVTKFKENDIFTKGEVIEGQEIFKIDKLGNLFSDEILEDKGITKVTKDNKIYIYGEVVEQWLN